jgi:F420H(2)-dependent quinone reductase
VGRWGRGLYRVLNAGMGLLLRSPLHGLVSGRIMLLTITGRRSGRSLTVPVSYLRYGEDVIVFTSGERSAWWKNLRGAPR